MAGSKKNAGKRFERERAARILVDAIALGDKTASDRHQVCEKTIQRYRKRLLEDPGLSRRVQDLGREAEYGWHFARAQFLRRTLLKLEKLVDEAGVEHFKDVIEALKAAGELDLARELSIGVSPATPQPHSSLPEDGGGKASSGYHDEA